MLIPTIVLALVMISMVFTVPAFAESAPLIVKQLSSKVHNAMSFTGTGIELNTAIGDIESISIIFQVSVSDSGGDVVVGFDRSIFDAKIADEDDEFFIVGDGGEEIQFEEEKTDTERILSFSVPYGTEEFEIFGTSLLGESFILQVEEAKRAAEEADAAMDKEIAAALAYSFEQQAIRDEEQRQERLAAKAQAEEESRLAVLQEACGEGTTFVDGECVAPIEEPIESGPLINSIFAAMGIGLAVMIILWGIGRSRHKKSSVTELDDS